MDSIAVTSGALDLKLWNRRMGIEALDSKIGNRNLGMIRKCSTIEFENGVDWPISGVDWLMC